MIETIIDTGSVYCDSVLLTEEELNQRKEKLRQDALGFLNEVKPEDDVEHIVYYHDERDAENNIQLAWLYYNMVGLDHQTFIERAANISGQIGEVHRS